MTHKMAIAFCFFSFAVSIFLIIAHYKRWHIDWGRVESEEGSLRIQLGLDYDFPEDDNWFVILFFGLFYLEISSTNSFQDDNQEELETS